MRRMGRPGLIGTMARTAVIAGTAQAVGGAVAQKQRAAAQAQAAAAAPAPAAAPTPAPAETNDIVAQLTQLNQLKAAGLIDDAEFAAAKAKALGI